MAKQTITTVAIGNCGASSNYNDEERERHKNIMELMDKKEQRTIGKMIPYVLSSCYGS